MTWYARGGIVAGPADGSDAVPVQFAGCGQYIRSTYGKGGRQVGETTGVTVIDQNGRSHDFDADDFKDDGAYLEIVKGSERVARFAPGYIGVYKASAERATAVVRA